MTIAESQPGTLICINLQFLWPLCADDLHEFIFKPEVNQAVISWSMGGQRNFMFKLVGLCMTRFMQDVKSYFGACQLTVG
jgi:hypothetical protein